MDEVHQEDIKILLVHFAGKSEKAEKNRKADTSQLERVKENRKLHFKVATHENFIKEINWADIIYLGGGTTIKLLEELKKYKKIQNHFDGKIVAGESAGANVIGEYCYSKSGGGVIRGLGILPVFVYPHFEGEKHLSSEQIPSHLEEFYLKEYEFNKVQSD